MAAKEGEKELTRYIAAQSAWEKVPANIKVMIENNAARYTSMVLNFSLTHQLAWAPVVGIEEKKYLEEMVKRSRVSLMIYPYHLASQLHRMLRVTPFNYYIDMMIEVMVSERSYDSVPNFTAADVVRLVGVGRNEYIDMMNKYRGKSGWRQRILKSKDSCARALLPPITVFTNPEYWWIVHSAIPMNNNQTSAQQSQMTSTATVAALQQAAAGVSATAATGAPSPSILSQTDGTLSADVEDLLKQKQCTEQERATLCYLESGGPRPAGSLDKSVVVSLMQKGLVFLSVPVRNTDLISVPPLENFVMNRVSGDHFETLLYDIFVSIDERTTVEQLSEVLQTKLEGVKQAIAVYCMLGMAKNKSIEPIRPSPEWHESWLRGLPAVSPAVTSLTPLDASSADSGASTAAALIGDETNKQTAVATNMSEKRIGFIFDSTLTAFLMMGNLGTGLKMHAVTMFEVGKLADEALDDLLVELEKVVNVAEGDAQRYAEHAICLREMIKFIRKTPTLQVSGAEQQEGRRKDIGLDLLRCERLNALDKASLQRVLAKNYSVLVSMAPITFDSFPVCPVVPHHYGPAVPEVNSIWFKLFTYAVARSGPGSVLFVKGSRIRKLPEALNGAKNVWLHAWGHEPVVQPANQLLPVLNARLQVSAVFVQVHSYSNEAPTYTDYALPYIAPAHKTGFSDVAQQLSNSLQLDRCCGYLRFVHIPQPHKQQQDAEESLVLDSISFGIPIFNQELNRRICQLIAEKQLFGEEALVKARAASRLLSIQLLDFIHSTMEPGHGTPEDMASAIANGTTILPTRHIIFSNGVITTVQA